MNKLQQCLIELLKDICHESDLTNNGDLWDTLKKLNDKEYMALRNNANFVNLMKSIVLQTEITHQNVLSNIIKEDTNKNITNLPHPNTHLDNVLFNNRFDKLILRLRNCSFDSLGSIMLGNHLHDILALTLNDLSRAHGIGKKYIQLFQELKSLYESNYISLTHEPHIPLLTEAINTLDLDDMVLNYSSLDTNEKKYFDLMAKKNQPVDLRHIAFFDSTEFSKTLGVGDKFSESISGISKKIQTDLIKIADGKLDYKKFKSKYILPKNIANVTLGDLGDYILEDIDNFLDDLEEDMQDIFQCRRGFVVPLATLDYLGKKYDLSRERIRQKEAKINNRLIRSLRFLPENIWTLIQKDINLDLPKNMYNLSSCFDKENNFYSFLNYICGDKNIQSLIRPNINLNLLNTFFAKNGAPCTYSDASDYLEDNQTISERKINIRNAMQYLEEEGRISIDGEKIYPQRLSRQEAAACILANHSNGLPWLDIAKIFNTKNYSRATLPEHRLDTHSLSDSSFIYLAGKGIYKHTKFIDFTKIDIDGVFNDLLVFFDETNRDVFHLNEVYKKSSYLKKYSYYVIRYIVKMHGVGYGFYFAGKSQVDSIGLKADFKYTTQTEVILQAMQSNNKPMTKPEIASLLKSNSLNHASYYLDQMIKNEIVVQVDRMLYTTPEIAYKNININIIIEGIQGILSKESRPVDPSIFQEILNSNLDETYSKHFYNSIAKKSAGQLGWYRNHNLYSLEKITYKNLTDLITKHCRKELDSNANFQELIKHVAITKEAALNSLGNLQ